MTWVNFFHKGLREKLTDGHLQADDLRAKIAAHDGTEAFHCAFDLVKEELKLEDGRPTFTGYAGTFRPAMGYVWYDFDSADGGQAALDDTRNFVQWLGIHDAFVCYSGSKGFHVGVPFGYTGLAPSPAIGTDLHRLAQHLKKTRFKTLDTTVFNPQRKFRALGSKHPKTGRYKAICDLSLTLDEIKVRAANRGELTVPVPELRSPLPHLAELFHVEHSQAPPKGNTEKEWLAPSGTAAFVKCGFLARCKETPASISEPQWYAALSIVSRFQDGRKQCHSLSHGHPGYSASQCNDKIDQALNESAPRTCQNVSTLWDGCQACPLYGKINSPVNIFDTRFYIAGDKGKLVPDYNSLLTSFHDDKAYKTIADMKAVYRFTGTHYEEYTPIEIKAFAEQAFEPKPQEKLRQEFYHKVLANSVARRSFFIDTTQDCLNFRNGVLRLGTNASNHRNLEAHSPAFGFRGCLPYDYAASATCPTFEWWINDVMLGDQELIAILQEFMGYVVRGGEYKYHKALWLSGSGRNGKSTFLDVLKALIGADNYSSLSIKAIIGDKFSSADLDGKIANFSEETSPEELSDSGPFKNLTGDGDVQAQKKYGDPYKFRNRAKLIMTYNEVPMLKDLSPGMLSRPIIIPWKKDLTNEALQDRTLKAKLLAELPGIFNFALRGWERLEKQRDFTRSAKSELEMEEIRSSSCSAASWFAETIELVKRPLENQDVLRPRQLYEVYKQTVGQYAFGEQKFYKRLSAMPEVAKRRFRSEKGVEYFGMKFRRGALGPVEF